MNVNHFINLFFFFFDLFISSLIKLFQTIINIINRNDNDNILNEFSLHTPMRCNISRPLIKLYIFLMNPSMKITSLKQMHMYFNFVGNACISEKSWSCMAVEKSKSMCVKFGHLLANSCKTVCVMSSMGSSMYLREGPNLMLQTNQRVRRKRNYHY